MIVICHTEQDVNKRGGAFKQVLIQKSTSGLSHQDRNSFWAWIYILSLKQVFM